MSETGNAGLMGRVMCRLRMITGGCTRSPRPTLRGKWTLGRGLKSGKRGEVVDGMRMQARVGNGSTWAGGRI